MHILCYVCITVHLTVAMNVKTKIYVSQTGRPFSDLDAAEHKARVLSAETGEPFCVSQHEAGFIVHASDTGITGNEAATTISAQESEEGLPDMTGLEPLSSTVAATQEDVVLTPRDDASEDAESLSVESLKSPAAANNPESDFPATFQLRPALRSYYGQYVAAFFGLLIYARPTWLLFLVMTEQELFASERKWIGELLPDAVATVGLGLALLSLGRVAFDYFSHCWLIGEDFVDGKVGLLSRKEGSGNIQLADVQSFYPRQTVMQSVVLGTGNVELGTAGTAGVDLVLKNVLEPEKLIGELKRRKKIATKKRFQRDS